MLRIALRDELSCRVLPAIFSLASAVALCAGCGSRIVPALPSVSLVPGNTNVTLLLSSTANDQLTGFNLEMTSLTLTGQSGASAPLFSSAPYPTATYPLFPEFIHLNGTAEPYLNASIPQGTYTAATMTIGGSGFSCSALDASGGLQYSSFNYGATPASQITVTLPSPITVSGAAMGLDLNLLASKSATYATCIPNGVDPYSINPTFDLTAVSFAAQNNTVVQSSMNLQGLVVAAGSTSLIVAGGDGPQWAITLGANTLFQGVSGSSGLSSSMTVDVDASIQSDGSLLASRVAVLDSAANTTSTAIGPLEFVEAAQPTGEFTSLEEQGYLYNIARVGGSQAFSFGNATFQSSGETAELATPPFTRAFTAANMVPGQMALYSFHATRPEGSPTYLPAATVTLLPQTINGTVQSIASSSGFTTYTILLASYDMFPTLSVQAGQTTLLAHPNLITVYVDPNAQRLNSATPAVGSVLRFRGLVFNDGGTLKMDCSQVSDGVTE